MVAVERITYAALQKLFDLYILKILPQFFINVRCKREDTIKIQA